jgi:hypothetical protein
LPTRFRTGENGRCSADQLRDIATLPKENAGIRNAKISRIAVQIRIARDMKCAVADGFHTKNTFLSGMITESIDFAQMSDGFSSESKLLPSVHQKELCAIAGGAEQRSNATLETLATSVSGGGAIRLAEQKQGEHWNHVALFVVFIGVLGISQ